MVARFMAFVLVLVGSLAVPLSANGAEDLRFLGAGVIMATSPYNGVGTKTMAVPILGWDYKNFYVKGVEAGYHFYKNDTLTLSVLGVPRFMGYSSEDSTDLNGMEDRRMSVDVGVKADVKLPLGEEVVLGVKVLTDAASRHDGQDVELNVSKLFRSKYFRLTPSAGARLQSSRMVDYYYGVEANEVRAGRPEYEPGQAINCFGKVLFSFGISQNWIVVTMSSVEFLDSEIRKSPIVDRDYLLTGVVGLTRRF
jgi:MipA family protein